MGVLVAVDHYLELKGVKTTRRRMSKEWYSSVLSRMNRKLNVAFINAYEGLHLVLGYDGVLVVKAAQGYLEEGRRVIELCEKG